MRAGPLLVFSVHLDDAVLSLGGAIGSRPGSTVVTVLAGLPEDATMLTTWDRSCGFSSAADAMAARLAEDHQALQELDATPVHLPFLAGQYGTHDDAEMVGAIAQLALAHPQHHPVCLLGLEHPDHRVVSEAFLRAMLDIGVEEFCLAADIPYCAEPHRVRERLGELTGRAYSVQRLTPGPADPQMRVRARSAYVSQLGKLEASYTHGELDLPEALWWVQHRTRGRFAVLRFAVLRFAVRRCARALVSRYPLVSRWVGRCRLRTQALAKIAVYCWRRGRGK